MEISGLFCHSDFTWNRFWSFWSTKIYHFDHLSSFEFWIFGNFWHFQVWNVSKNQKFKVFKIVRRQFLTLWNRPKLISRKIIVIGNLLNFHTVEYLQLKFSIMLPRSGVINFTVFRNQNCLHVFECATLTFHSKKEKKMSWHHCIFTITRYIYRKAYLQ